MAFARSGFIAQIFSGTVSLETQKICSFFVFDDWGMFTYLAYGTSGLALNTERGAMTEFVTKVAVNRRCDRNIEF